MNTPDTQMIRRTEVQMTRLPGMPFFTAVCPYCGTKKNVTRDGEHPCEGCGATLDTLKPRKR